MAIKKEQQFYDSEKIGEAISALTSPKEPFEIRIVPTSKSKKVISGYFDDTETLLKALETINLKQSNIYITLGTIKPELMSREQSNRFIQGAATTSDNDMVGYKWLLIDLDPKRVSGVSSSEEELQAAFALAKQIKEYLSSIGFSNPLRGISGNGAHLLYKVSLLNTQENRDLVENVLKSLDALFSNEKVDVDTSTFNPSRVSKLYGTLAQKGTSKADRPHRMSRLLNPLEPIGITDKAYLEKLVADVVPKEEAPQQYNNYKPTTFDVKEWLDKHGVSYTEKSYKNGLKLVLDECPFDHSHKAPDSAVFVHGDGALGFKCLHNSCSGKGWKDLRVLLEPTAYEKKVDNHIEEGWKKHNRDKVEIQPDAPMFETAEIIFNRRAPEREFIRTGIHKLDEKLRGLEKGKVSVLTGLRGGSKSTILSQIALQAADDGHTVVCYSGELSDKSFLNWFFLQAAGRGHVEEGKHKGFYEVPRNIQESIAKWLGDRFYLYNNNYGHKWERLVDDLSKQVESVKADLLIIDNLMTVDISSYNVADKYEAQTKFIQSLSAMAKRTNCHVLFVAHPRKANGLLRIEDISGTSNLTNYVDSAFIVHRVNTDFKINAKAFFHWGEDAEVFASKCTNTLEIAKDRESGTSDYWIDLYFEPETKRLKNYQAEYKQYKWEISEAFNGVSIADDIDF